MKHIKKTVMLSAVFIACFGIFNSKAQTVNGVLISEVKSDYIELRAIYRPFSDKIWISLEYGQKISDENVNTYIRDDQRKPLEFNSALDAVNKMKTYGYELLQVYIIKKDSDTNYKYYVMKRR